MKRLKLLAPLLCCAILPAGCAPLSAPAQYGVAVSRVAEIRDAFLTPSDDVMIVAHRGCWKHAAENAVSAIHACRRLGIEIVELDVRRTRDGVLVLMHDDMVDRTTDGTGPAEAMTLAEFKRLRLRAGAGGPDAPLTDEAPPTLAEAIEAARGALLVNIDAKGPVVLDAVRTLDEQGLLDHAIIKTTAPPTDPVLQRMIHAGTILYMPVLDERRLDRPLSDEMRRFHGSSPAAYEIVFQTQEYLEEAMPGIQAQGRRLWVNTLRRDHAAGHTDARAMLDPDAHWGALARWGATIIQTDEPEALAAWLREKDLRR